jgi:hypothetical protein
VAEEVDTCTRVHSCGALIRHHLCLSCSLSDESSHRAQWYFRKHGLVSPFDKLSIHLCPLTSRRRAESCIMWVKIMLGLTRGTCLKFSDCQMNQNTLGQLRLLDATLRRRCEGFFAFECIGELHTTGV